MENFGGLCLILAFCLGVYSILASVIGSWKQKPFLLVSAQRAVYSVWVLVTTASGLLIYALMTDDFRLQYVWGHSKIGRAHV